MKMVSAEALGGEPHERGGRVRRKPSLPSGERIYAIGDIHGRFDLFEQLISLIRKDSEARGKADVRLVLLGDIIDRGAESANLVLRCMTYANTSDKFVVLKGNHEQAMVEALMGNFTALAFWRRFGGDATLRSWGVSDAMLHVGQPGDIIEAARSQVPTEVLRWLDRLPLTYRRGSYLFVHAGLRPNVRLAKQAPGDLLWIRDEFLTSDADHAYMVVHGHSIREDVDLQRNRIGIDTGAYRTGRLTALGLQADQQWLLEARGPTGAIGAS